MAQAGHFGSHHFFHENTTEGSAQELLDEFLFSFFRELTAPSKMGHMSAAGVLLPQRIASHARHNPLAAVGVVLVGVFVTFALFAPWIAPQDPAAINLPVRLNIPSSAHWFGTDELGRDILSRVIY